MATITIEQAKEISLLQVSSAARFTLFRIEHFALVTFSHISYLLHERNVTNLGLGDVNVQAFAFEKASLPQSQRDQAIMHVDRDV